MKPLSSDTTPDVQSKHYELMRRLSPEQRLFIARVLPREDVIRAYGLDPKVEGFEGFAK